MGYSIESLLHECPVPFCNLNIKCSAFKSFVFNKCICWLHECIWHIKIRFPSLQPPTPPPCCNRLLSLCWPTLSASVSGAARSQTSWSVLVPLVPPPAWWDSFKRCPRRILPRDDVTILWTCFKHILEVLCLDYWMQTELKVYFLYFRVTLVAPWSVRRLVPGLWLVSCPGVAAPAPPPCLECTPASLSSVPGPTRSLLPTKVVITTKKIIFVINKHLCLSKIV